MTPHSAAIKLLQLSRLELEEFIATQVIENPVLEDFKSGPLSEKPQNEQRDRFRQ